jgi:hypothetical protein
MIKSSFRKEQFMPKKPLNQGKSWTPSQEKELKQLVKGNTPTPLIAHKLGRTPAGVQSKAQDLNVSLKPVNKSPYNRRGK